MELKTLLWFVIFLFILSVFMIDIWNEKRILGYKSRQEKRWFNIISITIYIAFTIFFYLLVKTLINL